MATKGKNKPLSDALSKASKALAKSRQLRDPGKTLTALSSKSPRSQIRDSGRTSTNANSKSPLTPKKTAVVFSNQIAKLEAKASHKLDTSSDDDDDDLNLLAEKSPSTFLEALDKYNSGMVSKRRIKSNIAPNVNIRSDEISDISLKSILSSGTPSISLTKSEKLNNNRFSNQSKLASAQLSKAQATIDKIQQQISGVAKRDSGNIDDILGKAHISLDSVKIPISPIRSSPSFDPGIGHPHETVTALMKRGDKVSEETYRVLQMMVKGSETADAAFDYKERSAAAEIRTDSVADEVLITDATISMALEEELEEEFEAPVSLISENVTYVGETMEDIVENLMSLDLEEEEEVVTTKNSLEVDVFEFKADNTHEEYEEEYQDNEEDTLKEEYVYESDFEPESFKNTSDSVGKSTKSEFIRTKSKEVSLSTNTQQQSVSVSKSSPKTTEKSVTFSASTANKTARSSDPNYSSKSASNSQSQSEKPLSSSVKVISVSAASGKEVSFCPLTLPETSASTPAEKEAGFSKSQFKPLETYSPRSRTTSSSRTRSLKNESWRKMSENEPSATSPELEPEVSGPSKQDSDEEVNISPAIRQKSQIQSKTTVRLTKSSKTTQTKATQNPVEDLMNIDGERSSRQRQKILSILRKELYEKELKRLNREQLKAERIQKKREKKKEEDYRLFLKNPEPYGPKSVPEVIEFWKTNNRNANLPGTSKPPPPEYISHMMSQMDKYNNAASAGPYNRTYSKPKANVNFGAPYFTRSGDFAEGNFQPPEKVDIPDLVHEVLQSHQRMYEMTIQTAKQMGKKYRELVNEQNKKYEKQIARERKKSSRKVAS